VGTPSLAALLLHLFEVDGLSRSKNSVELPSGLEAATSASFNSDRRWVKSLAPTANPDIILLSRKQLVSLPTTLIAE